MARNRHVALLRGINVGGSNLIKMADLRASFEAMGFADVVTLIQSGNVVFSSKPTTKAKLVANIEAALSARFAVALRVVVVSAAELAVIVDEAPTGFGGRPGEYRYDVLFLKDPLTPQSALAQVTAKPGVDTVDAGRYVLYFRRLIAKATQSQLSRIVQKPVYQSLTIRNWNTTTKLAKLVQD